METAADRQAFLDADDAVLIWTVAEGAPIGINGVGSTFGVGHDPFGEGPGLIGRRASYLVPDELLPAGAAPTDSVTVGGVVYGVKEIVPDGTGMSIVRLEEDLDSMVGP